MHLALYEATGARAVVHTHSVFATVVASTMTELPPIHYNALLLGGAVRVAPYATYGTPELARNVIAAIEGRQAALMASHGAVTIGAGLEQAFEATRLLEWLCEVYVRALGVGRPRCSPRTSSPPSSNAPSTANPARPSGRGRAGARPSPRSCRGRSADRPCSPP
ncbi:hypothetical protein GCM10027612_74920 [Microbispora bryophytorum subsp. camponoti]